MIGKNRGGGKGNKGKKGKGKKEQKKMKSKWKTMMIPGNPLWKRNTKCLIITSPSNNSLCINPSNNSLCMNLNNNSLSINLNNNYPCTSLCTRPSSNTKCLFSPCMWSNNPFSAKKLKNRSTYENFRTRATLM